MKRLTILEICVGLAIESAAFAEPASLPCRVDWTTESDAGHKIQQFWCPDSTKISGRRLELRLDSTQVIYSASPARALFSFAPGLDRPKNLYFYDVVDVDELTCPSRLLLVDLRGPHPKAFEFGISQRCAEPSQAFWSTRKGVEKGTIIVKPDVKFTYTNGKLMPPDDPYPASQVMYTSDLLLDEAKRLGYPGAYVKEIPLE
jgi:hypothetical protein